MRSFRHAALFLFSLSVPLTASAAEQNLVVIELFTSEGCSSCPPADAYLAELADDKTLLPLSLHVDYWDHIGWKDPFASPGMTARQRAYQRGMNLRYAYTPQMVVQGEAEGVGSDRRKIGGLIRALRGDAKRADVPVSLSPGAGGSVTVTIPARAGRPERPATLYLVVFERARTVKVARGENAGRTLTHHNVVRSLTPVGTWKGGAFEATVALPRVAGVPANGAPPPPLSAAILVQEGDAGRILGAGRLALD